MAYYQNVAENGVGIAQGPEKISPAGKELAGMPAADAVVFLDSHLGYGFQSLNGDDPTVINEGQTTPIDASLDMFSKANGFDPGKTTYTDDWKRCFFKAQADRNNHLLASAQSRLAAVLAGEANFTDNEPFFVVRHNARLWMNDMSLLSHTKKAHTLLTQKGPVKTVIRSVRTAGIDKWGKPTGEADNLTYNVGTLKSDVVSFLSTHSIRANSDYAITEDDIIGVDYFSTNTATPANLAGIHVPVLLMSMTAHYWVVPNEIEYEYAASKDKTLVFVEGAMHSMLPQKPEYGDTLKMVADYVTDWICDRFDK